MDDDQEICRVCRCESTPDHPLFHPCKCSGSIRFVHEDCLIEWLSHSKKKYCELCEHPFTFSPIYRDDMPERLPFYVLCTQFIRRLSRLLKTCFRGLTVIFVWLIMLPNFTLWTWRFYFWSGENIGFVPASTYQMMNDTSSNNISTISTNIINATVAADMTNTTMAATTSLNTQSFWLSTIKNFLSDCLEGQIITAFVVIIFVAGYLFREWVMQNLPVEQPQILQQPQPVLRRQNNPRNANFIIDENNDLIDNRNQLLQEQAAIDTLLNAMRVLPNDAHANVNEEIVADHANDFVPRQRETTNAVENAENMDNESLNTDQRLHRQLSNVRVELVNELNDLQNDNSNRRSNDWTPIMNERFARDDDQLFGGIHNAAADMGRTPSNSTQGSQGGSAAAAAAAVLHQDHSFDTFIQQQHDNDLHHRHHFHTDDEEEPKEEHDVNREENVEEMDDDDENASLPDLVDEEQRRLNRDALHNMVWEHLANRGLHVPPEEARRQMAAMNETEDERQQRRQAAIALVEEAARQQRLERFNEALAGQAAAAVPPPRNNNIAAAAAAAAADNDDNDEPLDVGDDINGVLEAIGMRGNPWMLVQNSVLMSLMISLCLGVAIWIPFVVGRLVILIRPISFIETPIYLMRLITDPLVDFVLDLCLPFVWSNLKALLPNNIQYVFKTIQSRATGIFQDLTTYSHNNNQTAHSDFISSSTTAASTAMKTVIESTIENITEPINGGSLNLTNGILSMSPFAALMKMNWSTMQNKIENMSSLALIRWHRFATGRTAVDRSMCILVGYLVLILVGSWYLSHSQNSNTDRSNNNRRRRALAAAAAAANARGGVGANHQILIPRDTIRELIRQQGIFLKVLFFILIELIVFPTVCGFLLDFATLPLFADASLTTRYLFHLKRPYFSYFAHWFLGTGVLFYFAIFITVCREIIRPGVMWFIRDPNDPQFHPVQEMVERPFPNLLHKISQSALIYSFMLVFGVGTVTYTLGYIDGLFPLRLPFDTLSLTGNNKTALTSVAVDLLIVQFLVPPLIKFINPRAVFKKALGIWWRVASRQLRLTSFMFNERKLDEEGYHHRRTLKAWLLREKAVIPDAATDAYSEVAIDDENSSVVFRRDGMMVRVPKYDSVPVDPKRRMLVPVDPVTLEAIDLEERRRGHPAAADTNDESQATIVVYIPPYFKQRTIFFLFYMWLFISLFACSVTVLPLLAGRVILNSYILTGESSSKTNDLYSFTLGIYLMTGFGILVYWIKDYYAQHGHSGDHERLYQFIKEKAGKALKFFYLVMTVGVIIPFLLAVIVDLYIFLPVRDVNPRIEILGYFSLNWSLGIAYLSLVHNLIHVLPANNRVRRTVNEMLGGNGFMQTDVWTITLTIIGPVIICALLAIIVPGIISWTILQVLSKSPILLLLKEYLLWLMWKTSKGERSVLRLVITYFCFSKKLESRDAFMQISVTRYAYPAIFGICLIILIGFVMKKMLNIWLETVRNDTYLIGKRLHNMPTPAEQRRNSNSSS
ncbi:hypothetical protein BDF20DRAFT_998168 [Mycotypha africana]|uniref:uncharacterized protein n=1 Tax=Mycotypha africana TaxID=64632 RepID=UPI002301DC78|nr:uncharacterized protein BDF20DRAFT_998168 [Mycotypha africana]KAI8987552.1 hypothetical protein BDF20DRAFT_998168 [Mycotypha africana]